MALGQDRTVHVTTRAEFDAALQSADRVVVEGDESLLSYAVAQASGDPAHHIDLDLAVSAPAGGAADAPGLNAPLRDFAAPPAPVPPDFEDVFAPSPAPPAPAPMARPARRGRPLTWVMLSVVVVGLALMGVTLALKSHAVADHFAAVADKPGQEETTPVSPKSGVPKPERAGPVKLAGNVELVQAIAWPAVAIIAILALALIARQAIATGRNVEFSWKVTEKMSGRVVITKVKTPQPRRNRAAPA